MPRRAACSEWPTILNPAPGCYPLAAEMRATERTLHLALKTPQEPQAALERALRSISSQYEQVDWCYAERQPGGIEKAAQSAAARLNPTLVFLQIQRANTLPGAVIERLRAVCHPSCVIVQWDGDMHHTPRDPGRQWFIDLGRACDCNLTVETGYQKDYLAAGVRHPGYLEIGIDEQFYHPTEPTPGIPPVVLLAACYPDLEQIAPGGYAGRVRVAAECEKAYGIDGFGVYGSGWGPDPQRNYPGNVCRREFLNQPQEAGVYAAAAAALSLSIRCDLPRYTSDRLFRMLASGAVCLVENLPDYEGLGLVDGVNCLIFDEWDGLKSDLDEILLTRNSPRWSTMRQEAARLGLEHTWAARMPELLACIDAVRAHREDRP